MANILASVANMTEAEWQAFGAWFQDQRELAGVSQTQAAKAAGVHVVQLSRIENGHSGVKRDNLVGLVDAVNNLSTGHRINKEEALNKAGFAATGFENTTIDVTDDIQLILLGKDISPEDREEYERAVEMAVAIARQRIEEKKKKN
jgi:transcriptional regulator with XRE-family HTH domain